MVEGKRLVLVFQRTARKASGTRRLDAPTRARGRNARGNLLAMRRRDSVMIFASFPFFSFFLSKSQAPTHSTSLNHDMFPHSLSYLISCPISFILSFIFFRSFRLEGELGHLGLLGLETFGPWEDGHKTIYCGAMSNCSPTKESTQVVAIELILSWTSSQVNSGVRADLKGHSDESSRRAGLG